MTGIPRLALVLGAGFAFAACGDSGTGPGGAGLGTANVQITGAASHSFSGGLAVAGFAAATGLYVIVLEDMAGTVDLGFVREGPRPAPGTYTLGEVDSPTYAELSITQGGEHLHFDSVSGQLTITSSSPQSAQGTATFTARRAFGGSGEIQVSASFSASCIPGMALLTCD